MGGRSDKPSALAGHETVRLGFSHNDSSHALATGVTVAECEAVCEGETVDVTQREGEGEAEVEVESDAVCESEPVDVALSE